MFMLILSVQKAGCPYFLLLIFIAFMRNTQQHSHSIRGRPQGLFTLAVWALALVTQVTAQKQLPLLIGIGYREQALQDPVKPGFSREPNGLPYVSFGGDTHIFVQSYSFAKQAAAHTIMLESTDFQVTITCPPLTLDDTFNSNPAVGSIAYRLPSLPDMFQMPQEAFDSFQQMKFILKVLRPNAEGTLEILGCEIQAKCTLYYKKEYTPVLYYLTPPVLYNTATVEFWFNPKGIQSILGTIIEGDMPFVNGRLGDAIVDFEDTIYFDTVFNAWRRDRVRGIATNHPPGLAQPKFLWDTGAALIQQVESRQCNFDQTDCYQAKVVPVIFGLSQSQGYTTGGQNLTIEGFGFENATLDIKVGGIQCNPTVYNNTRVYCTVAQGGKVEADGPRAGQMGISRRAINGTAFDITKLVDYKGNETIAMSLERAFDLGDQNADLFRGWFVPPVTGKYKFWMACDDVCLLRFGETPKSTASLTTLLDVTKYSGYRDYWIEDGITRVSKELTLTKDELYYIEASHVENSGDDHMVVGVQIMISDPSHQHAMKEVQTISASTTQVFEKTRFIVSNPTGAEFKILFTNPRGLYNQSATIKDTATAAQFQSAVSAYYSGEIKTAISVVLEMFDAAGSITTDPTLTVKKIFTVTLSKLINGKSQNGLQIVKISGTPQVTFEQPDAVQLSKPPLGGKFKIKCVTSANTVSYTRELQVLATTALIVQESINSDCYQMNDKVQVDELRNDCPYRENCIKFRIRFSGLNDNPGQYMIESGTDTPLTGDDQQPITYDGKTLFEFGSSIFYNAVPFEMLRQYVEKPQVIMQVGTLPAVCHNNNCGFNFIEPTAKITSFTYNPATKALNIQGTDLPTTNMKIMFGLQNATVNSATTNQISATLVGAAIIGKWLPVVTDKFGLIPVDTSLQPYSETGTITQGACQCGTCTLNVLGGDQVTIDGANLPSTVAGSNISISFSNTKKSQCSTTGATNSQLKCLTHNFDKSTDLNKQFKASLDINGQVLAVPGDFCTKDTNIAVTKIEPLSANPVIKRYINITISAAFTQTLVASDFEVTLISKSAPAYKKQVNVVLVDDAKKMLICKFGGAISGDYSVEVKHKTYGKMDSESVVFKVESKTTKITPLIGSIYGGTLVTLTGTNWGNEKTDNPVEIYLGNGMRNSKCLVESTSETEIKCRIETSKKMNVGDKGKMIVFLKTYEEANCTDTTTKCEYTFTDQVPEITGMTSEWDPSSNRYIVKVAGKAITGTKDTVEMQIGGVKQETLTTSATEVAFKIIDAAEQTLAGALVYFDVGIGKGNNLLTGVTLLPKLVSVSPKQGSAGGTLITLNVQGVGFATTGLEVVNAAGVSICQSVTIPKYSVVKCLTKVQDIAAGTSLKVKLGGTVYACANTNAAECQYEQLEASAKTPIVTAVNVQGGTILGLTGTNLPTTGFTSEVTLSGIKSTTNTATSATSGTALYEMGVPYTNQAETPVIKYTDDANGDVYYALVKATVSLTQSVSLSSAGLTCSFAGGCPYEITNQGLTSKLLQDSTNNFIEVCSEKCVMDSKLSTATKAVCRVPMLATAYSIGNFLVSAPTEDLRSGIYFGSSANYAKAFDDNLGAGTDDLAANCHVGMKFNEGFVGQISQVKFYLKNINKDAFNNTLIFQGSNDMTTWTDLFTTDMNVHEGWNYKKWEDSTAYPKYKAFRFFGTAAGACNIKEIKFAGIKSIDDNSNLKTCPVKLTVKGVAQDLQSITYKGDITGKLVSANPRFGTVKGGTSVTFTGVQFSSQPSDYTILIDGVECVATAATTTSVTCTTGKRPGLPKSSLTIFISGRGYISNQGKRGFTYVNMWSDTTTWGGEFAPVDGESVYIPSGLNLLVDIDKSPVLNAVIVEGELIFAPDANPQHQRTFDAHYIYVHNGYMQVGTEEFPYTSKINITMYGNINSPYIPIYGNKVIGVNHGVLDMHGVKREPVWTVMAETSQIGDSQIKLIRAVDWDKGDLIAIAPTDYFREHYEKRTITKVDRTNPEKPILYLDMPLEFKHYAGVQMFDGEPFEMRAEVGLLSRNVKYRGDPETSYKNTYGATIFIHSHGDDSVIARLADIELTDVGQAFLVGRYAVHFHMIGAVHKSYATRVAVHESFNRAFTIHGTFNLRLINNVVCHAMGHNFFIEDAVEKKNVIRDNLVMGTERSWSLLNTDQTPASFWITHPDNEFQGNHAAGSDRYGYWFDLKEAAMGPSVEMGGCPEFHRVGTFYNNTAHSNGRYGLRVFKDMVPREYECKPIIYDRTAAEKGLDPFWQNPIQTVIFKELTSWKNQRNGAIARQVGDVRFEKFKTADNILAGVEFEETTNAIGDDRVMVYDSLLVGASENSEPMTLEASPAGVICPRREWFTIKNVRFHNYNFKDAHAIGDCSHCDSCTETDSGARTVKTKELKFFNVKRKIMYHTPFRGIFLDLDGTLTGLGPNTWATKNYPHLEQPECQLNVDTYDGVICDNTVQVRRISFHSYSPKSLLEQTMKIIKWDDNILSQYKNVSTEYMTQLPMYTLNPMKQVGDPGFAYTAAFVTGHKYKIHWATGIDVQTMNVQISERWEEADKDIVLIHNFTEQRMAINVTLDGVQIPNNSISANPALLQTGQNVVYNDTQYFPRQELQFVVNGKGRQQYQRRTIKLAGLKCLGSCTAATNVVPIETGFRLWSNPSSWTSGKVPVAGEDVLIEPGWNMVYDVAESPILNTVTVNGRLSFKNDTDLHLKANHIYIRTGELRIGFEDKPFANKAIITLHGGKLSKSFLHDSNTYTGNKIIANVGNLTLIGKPRSKMTRLFAEVSLGTTAMKVGTGLDWVPGDRIAFADTSFDSQKAEDRVIQSYDKLTGDLVVTEALKYHHWGAAQDTIAKYGVDIRCEVALLTRNIVIRGENLDTWGGQIVTGEIMELNTDGELVWRIGRTKLDSVEIFNCSQFDTTNAALRFESHNMGSSSVKNTAIHNGYSHAIYASSVKNIELIDNTIYNHVNFGILLKKAENVTIEKNLIMQIRERIISERSVAFDQWAGISACGYAQEGCINVKINNNIIAGAIYVGIVAPGLACDTENTQFANNVAHSIRHSSNGYGAMIYSSPDDPRQKKCTQFSKFTAYKIRGSGLVGGYNIGPDVYRFKDITLFDNGVSMAAAFAGLDVPDRKTPRMEIENNIIMYDSEIQDCPAGGKAGLCFKISEKYGYRSYAPLAVGYAPHPSMAQDYPYHIFKKKEALLNGEVILKNNTFLNFPASATILDNDQTPDLLPIQYFYDTRFVNCSQSNLVYMPDPDPSLANIRECGQFPCTGNHNYYYQFFRTQWQNPVDRLSTSVDGDFQIIPNNPGFSKYVPDCQLITKMNAWICHTDNLGVLHFESEDENRLSRSIQPIYYMRDNGEINKINIHMEHCWDGFYACQKRLPRVHGLVRGGKGVVYNVTYTGTPPQKQVFLLDSNYPEAGMTVRIFYPGAESKQVIANGKNIPMTPWIEAEKNYAPVTQAYCGENRFIGIKNILEFYITPGCRVRIVPRDAIQCNVRMEWTFAEFFADGGTTKFVDRLAASLGIHGSEIKIVSVYEGSLIVDYLVFSAVDDLAELERVKQRQIDLLARNLIKLGAPILDSSVSQNQIIKNGVVTATGYKPIIITPTSTNGGISGTGTTTINGGSTTSSGGSSTSTSTSTSSTTTTTNVKTGTKQEFQQNNFTSDWDPFAHVKVLTEEQKQLKTDILNQYNEQRAKIEEAYKQQRAILEQQKAEAESKQETMSVVLISVISVLLIGITIFAMIKLIKHFNQPARQVKEDKPEEYERVDYNTTTKNVGLSTEYEQQFDARKMFDMVPDLDGKVIPNMTEMTNVNILNTNMVNLKAKTHERNKSGNKSVQSIASQQDNLNVSRVPLHASGETKEKTGGSESNCN